MSSSFDAKMPTRVVEGIINVEPILSGELVQIINSESIKKWIDSIAHFSDGRFSLKLVADNLDSQCKEKETEEAYASCIEFDNRNQMFKYRCQFEVPEEFGKIGAVLVQNEHHKEKYIKNIVLDDVNVIFTCESWIHSKFDNPSKRIFFTSKSYLPSKTPNGLKFLREEDLKSLRGNGEGKRKSFERVYDYDTYNDLGDPDTRSDLSRPVLGGGERPYPRRCRTGRAMTSKEPRSESRTKLTFYVPRDEAFSDTKAITFGVTAILFSKVKALIPSLDEKFMDVNNWFSSIKYLEESLFEKWLELCLKECAHFFHLVDVFKVVVRRLLKDLMSSLKTVLHIEDTQSMEGKLLCYKDEEFCRQTLAGLNPYSIQLVMEWPLMSKLDPEVYGPAESAITKEIVEQEIKGFMTLEKALEQKKLFLLDYHDILLPYVNKVRELEGTILYGSRTLMFLTSTGILKPLAIELTRPPNNGKQQWKHVYTPGSDGNLDATHWLWEIAKAHVLAHDSGYHQLVSHWLRTHCVTEPYIIATNRQLSKMHPIERLLSPHFRYTMQINGLARQALINAGGIIESTFSLGKYSMQLSSDAYKQWRFDHEALPADLISRGMAIEDPSAPQGMKLAIEDYPFANDGLILWDAIKHWATAYVNHYYPQPDLVQSDKELQAWWLEIRTVGHGDKKDEPWWPELKTQQDLIGIVSTIMWVASGHHSAVNFGQYIAGNSPHRPTIARTKMPDEDPTSEEWQAFVNNPEDALRNCLPLHAQSKIVTSTLDALSSHSPDEEYIGVNMEAAWEAEPAIKAAFQEFSESLKALEDTIDSRNGDPDLKNRIGKGYVYELFKPFSEPGVTGKGVPYSISI